MTKRQDPRGHHGQTVVQDRGMRFGTHVQTAPMADGTTPRGRYGYGKGRLEDALASQRDGQNNASQRKSKGQSVIDEALDKWPQEYQY